MIRALGLSGFFILHREMLELAREVAVEVRGPDTARALLPPGRGRGSSVSSIVCYLTGLSHIDPIANELFLGRFLNEEMTALPDIDLDFPRDVREELIPRVHERYGATTPRWSPPSRPTARAARSARSARRSACRRGRSSASRAARRAGRRATWTQDVAAALGRASASAQRPLGVAARGSPTRRTGCRAT